VEKVRKHFLKILFLAWNKLNRQIAFKLFPYFVSGMHV
jgi:hypothetical protein